MPQSHTPTPWVANWSTRESQLREKGWHIHGDDVEALTELLSEREQEIYDETNAHNCDDDMQRCRDYAQKMVDSDDLIVKARKALAKAKGFTNAD